MLKMKSPLLSTTIRKKNNSKQTYHIFLVYLSIYSYRISVYVIEKKMKGKLKSLQSGTKRLALRVTKYGSETLFHFIGIPHEIRLCWLCCLLVCMWLCVPLFLLVLIIQFSPITNKRKHTVTDIEKPNRSERTKCISICLSTIPILFC